MGVKVRQEILRHYLEALFDGELPRRFAGATFEEYVALLRLRYPATTQRWAVDMAGSHGRPDLMRHPIDEPAAAATGAFAPPDDELASLGDPRTLVRVLRRGPSDLRQVLVAGARALECVNATIGGWSALSKGSPWLHVELRMCKGDGVEWVAPPVETRVLRVVSCDDDCLASAVGSTSARILDVHHAAPLDLRLLAGHSHVERLRVGAPVVHGARALSIKGLRVLSLVGASFDDEARALLEANAATLETLTLSGPLGFAPDWLPPLPRLKLLIVTADPRHRAAWIAYALDGARHALDFTRVRAPQPKEPTHRHVSADRDADLFEVTRGAKKHWELRATVRPSSTATIAGTLASLARAQRHKIKARCEGATVVVEVLDEATCRWAASALGEAAAPTSAGVPPPRAGGELAPPGPRKKKASAAGGVKKSADGAPLVGWEGHLSPKILSACRTILADAAEALRALEKETVAKRRAALGKCVERLNELDAAHDHFIGTLEAEELFDAVVRLGAGAGVGDAADVVESRREW